MTAMSLTRLSAKTSIGSFTTASCSERQRPGIGEVLSTMTVASHDSHGFRRSAWRVAALKPSSSGNIGGGIPVSDGFVEQMKLFQDFVFDLLQAGLCFGDRDAHNGWGAKVDR
jgi:hypothetical protein